MSNNQTSELEGGLDADRGGSVIACAIVFILSCSLILTLRFASHAMNHRAIFVEDWLMIPAYVMMMGLCANVICSMIHVASPQLLYGYRTDVMTTRRRLWPCWST